MRTVVREGEEDVMGKIKKKFKEIKVEGNRKSVTGVNYTKSEQESTKLHDTKYPLSFMNRPCSGFT